MAGVVCRCGISSPFELSQFLLFGFALCKDDKSGRFARREAVGAPFDELHLHPDLWKAAFLLAPQPLTPGDSWNPIVARPSRLIDARLTFDHPMTAQNAPPAVHRCCLLTHLTLPTKA